MKWWLGPLSWKDGDKGAGWEMTTEPGGRTRFDNPDFGSWQYGKTPHGYDTWVFHELGGGGILVIPYCFIGTELHVVLLKTERFNLVGLQDYEAIGGFQQEGEVGFKGAAREALEEADLEIPSPMEVNGRRFASNRAFFALNGEEEGCQVWAFELSVEQQEAITQDGRLVLTHWKTALDKTRDALSIAAIARLFAQFYEPPRRPGFWESPV